MKILLLHEMSGVHTNLKFGLEKIGHEVDIATYGDGWKQYPSGINIGRTGSDISAKFSRLWGNFSLIKIFSYYDVVQIISPDPFFPPISKVILNALMGSSAKKVYIAAGSDAIYRKYVRELKYFPPHDWFENTKKFQKLKDMLLQFDAVVPVCWEYKYCMNRADIKTTSVIPFPIIENEQVKRSSSNRIRVFHPINRPNHKFDFKGTEIIESAFADLRGKYESKADFISKGGLPYKDYLREAAKADIIVDQVYSYSYGMSAAIGLRQGQVVLSGREDDIKSERFYAESPIINITPDKEDVKNRIAECLSDSFISDVGKQGFRFAAEHHDAATVAKAYEALYLALIK